MIYHGRHILSCCPLMGDELVDGGEDMESRLIGLNNGLKLSSERDSIDDKLSLCGCDGSCGT